MAARGRSEATPLLSAVCDESVDEDELWARFLSWAASEAPRPSWASQEPVEAALLADWQLMDYYSDVLLEYAEPPVVAKVLKAHRKRCSLSQKMHNVHKKLGCGNIFYLTLFMCACSYVAVLRLCKLVGFCGGAGALQRFTSIIEIGLTLSALGVLAIISSLLLGVSGGMYKYRNREPVS
jgi:hypothetical protein